MCGGGDTVKAGEVVLGITDPRVTIGTLTEVGRYKASRSGIDE